MRKSDSSDLLLAIKHGAAAGGLAVLIICLILSAILTFADIPDIIISGAVVVMLSAFCYICAYRSTQICRRGGIKQGAISGAIAALPILVISSISCGYVSDYCLVKISACLIFGIIGGIRGINTKRTKAK